MIAARDGGEAVFGLKLPTIQKDFQFGGGGFRLATFGVFLESFRSEVGDVSSKGRAGFRGDGFYYSRIDAAAIISDLPQVSRTPGLGSMMKSHLSPSVN